MKKKQIVDTASSSSDEELSQVSGDGGEFVVQLVEDYKTESYAELAVNFLCSTTNHPAISCFRELSGPDINFLLHNLNKVKTKIRTTVDQGILYLGLIDYLAITIDNFLYTEDKKGMGKEKIPVKVGRLMMELKNILGSWGMSDNQHAKNRYDTVMRHLRGLIEQFELIQWGEGFTKILNAIEKEVAKNKHNSEMMKVLSGQSCKVEIAISDEPESTKGVENGSSQAGEEYVKDFNIDMDIDLTEMGDDDDEAVEDKRVFKESHDASGLEVPKEEKLELVLLPKQKVPKNGVKKQPEGKIVKSKSTVKSKERSENKLWKLQPATNSVASNVQVSNSDKKPTNGNKVQKTFGPNAPMQNSPLPLDEVISLSPCKDVKEKDSEVVHPKKKPKLTTENIENELSIPPPKISNSQKPQVNAFALMMSRSKEIRKESIKKKKK